MKVTTRRGKTNSKKSQTIRQGVERLEDRRLLTAQISFANFSSTTGLQLNGYGSSATTSGNSLLLTDATGEARSALSTTKVPVNTFTAHFTYNAASNSNQADGFTFVIDNGSDTDLGGQGQYFGYSNGTFSGNSVALAFDLYNQGNGGTYFGSGTGGTQIGANTDASPMDLHNGDNYNFTVTYDGTNLTVTGVDATNSADSFTNTQAINLTSVLGGSTAFVGFTGATGFQTSTQTISAFDFTGTAAGPTVTTAASSNPTIVTGTKSHLTVGVTDSSSSSLTYAWTVAHKPPGAATPTFSTNNSSDPTTTAHYFKDGTYNFLVTATDGNGASTSSLVQVVVQQTATSVRLMPHKAMIKVNTTKQFSGTINDQFGRALRTQPALLYAIATGPGSIDSTSGLYTASATKGHLVISLTGDDLTGTAGATVIS